MQTHFTRGPWRTDEAEHDCRHQDIEIQGEGRRIAKVWIDDAPVEDYNAEQRANARLIKAAPDLLEALQALLEAVDGVPCGPEQQCRDAIAKALGRRP